MYKVEKKVCAFVLFFCLVIGLQGSVLASETTVRNDQSVIVVDSFDDIVNEYDCEEGTYLEVLDDGLIAEYTIDENDISDQATSINRGMVTYSTSTSTVYKKTVTLTTKLTVNGKFLYQSEIDGTFKYDGTYSWGTSGIAYFKCGSDVKSYKYTENKYSSEKVKGKSYYNVSMTITSSTYGKIYLTQYVGCGKKGKACAGDSRTGAI